MGKKSASRRNRRNSPNGHSAADPPPKNDLSIVAIGASAGGIEAFTELMSDLPADTGMAFVLIQHLDPKHHSLLTELFSKKTSMPVKEVTNGMRVESNHVYIIPPNAVMSISNHSLRLSPREDSRSLHMPIDHFMRALAEDLGNQAIGVILSGSGTDGTLGLAEIQAHGGLAFVQEKTSARYSAMPGSAIAAGHADYVLPPKGIARELARIARHPYVARDYSAEPLSAAASESARVGAIFQALHAATGMDFTHYRQTTILRRIQRRMVLHKIDKLAEYARYVQSNPSEFKALYHDLLINVTSFFRNPRVFDALKEKVFPPPFSALVSRTVAFAFGLPAALRAKRPTPSPLLCSSLWATKLLSSPFNSSVPMSAN